VVSPLHSAPQGPFPCILDWSAQMTRAEDLLNAVVITVIRDRLAVEANKVAALVAPSLEVEMSSLPLRLLSPSSFLLLLPASDGRG
jgi:hypothetical protein